MGDVPGLKDNSTVAVGIPKATQPLHTKEEKGVSEDRVGKRPQIFQIQGPN